MEVFFFILSTQFLQVTRDNSTTKILLSPGYDMISTGFDSEWCADKTNSLFHCSWYDIIIIILFIPFT